MQMYCTPDFDGMGWDKMMLRVEKSEVRSEKLSWL
jgi:hypothetical protein